MKRWSILILLLLTQLAGCVVVSQQPLAGAPLAPDAPLLGSWYALDGDNPVFLHVGFAGEREELRVELVEFSGGRLKAEHYLARPAKVGEESYLSIRQFDERGELSETYHLVRYRTRGESLEIAFLDPVRVAEAVVRGRIPGVVERPYGSVRLTAPPDLLAALLARAEPSLLLPAAGLKRLPLPYAGEAAVTAQ